MARKQKKTQGNRKAILLMLVCTFFLAAAQYFWKVGADTMDAAASAWGYWPLAAGLACAGLGAVIMTVALKHGDLSHVYPFIALSFIWTAIIAALIFSEPITPPIWGGMVLIIAGVVTLARSGVGA